MLNHAWIQFFCIWRSIYLLLAVITPISPDRHLDVYLKIGIEVISFTFVFESERYISFPLITLVIIASSDLSSLQMTLEEAFKNLVLQFRQLQVSTANSMQVYPIFSSVVGFNVMKFKTRSCLLYVCVLKYIRNFNIRNLIPWTVGQKLHNNTNLACSRCSKLRTTYFKSTILHFP